MDNSMSPPEVDIRWLFFSRLTVKPDDRTTTQKNHSQVFFQKVSKNKTREGKQQKGQHNESNRQSNTTSLVFLCFVLFCENETNGLFFWGVNFLLGKK